MEIKTLEALRWIIKILYDNNVPYQLGGGAATNLYGSGRKVNDIDISISGKHFPVIVESTKDYIVVGPKHYVTDKWNCVTLSLNYHGQDIDLTDADTLLMSDITSTKWIENKKIYESYPSINKQVADFSICLMHPKVLMEYKKELSGEHQEYDLNFLKKYILEHNI